MARIVVFIPMYNCAKQIGRVIAQFDAATQGLFDEIVVIDNRSKDDGVTRATEALASLKGVRTRLLENRENYGLGGSHKVAFEYALANGFDHVVVLHGDDQGSIQDLVPLLRHGEHLNHDALLGARFAPGSRLHGYSLPRIVGNYVFNTLYSIAAARRLYDLGSGLNLYATAKLSGREWKRFRNDLTFNYYLTLLMGATGWRIRFFPISWREDDQISNVKMFSQATRVLRIVLSFVAGRARFFAQDHSPNPGQVYAADTLYQGPD
jgi:glycosyltransferase involved in cell wall biosynthesis